MLLASVCRSRYGFDVPIKQVCGFVHWLASVKNPPRKLTWLMDRIYSKIQKDYTRSESAA